MPRYVALLRGINVGGHRVRMTDLAALFRSAGFSNVTTFIASGNVVFDSPRRSASGLETDIERMLERALGYAVPTFVRTPGELASIVAFEAFTPDTVASAHAVHVGLLRAPPTPEVARALRALDTPVDLFTVHGRELYWLCRRKISESLVPASAWKRALGAQPTTLRNLTMMTRLSATVS